MQELQVGNTAISVNNNDVNSNMSVDNNKDNTAQMVEENSHESDLKKKRFK